MKKLNIIAFVFVCVLLFGGLALAVAATTQAWGITRPHAKPKPVYSRAGTHHHYGPRGFIIIPGGRTYMGGGMGFK